MELAIFALLLALFENAYPTSTELQSLLIFTTASAKDREMEELRGKWSNLASFKSAYSSLVNEFTVGFDQENYWTILLSRGEPDALFNDIQKAIQADDRTKVIVGRPNGIIDRIFLSPFCWRRGATDQMAFVMCNGKLEFAIDERGWEIDEKVEVNGGGMKGAEMAAEMQRRSVWIDLLPGVRMATASPLQKKSKGAEDEEKMTKKRNGKKKAAKIEEENVKESEDDERKEKEDEEKPKEVEKIEEKSKDDNEKEEEDDEEEDDLDELKRKCRYRLSCYGQKGIALSAKQRERQQILLAGRIGPPKGEKKSTMKDAADAAVKKMMAKEREGKMLREKYEKDGDKVLANFWSELERKNRCKYRKSCYQNGIVPEIEQQNAIIKWLGGGKREENVEQKEEELAGKRFSEMDELERKMHCQYRRSCLENGGIRVNIQNELDFLRVDLGDAMKAMRKWWAELEKKKMEKKEREKVEGHHEGREDDDENEKPFTKLECKYRKSCYESGKLPEHLQGSKVEKDPQDEHAVKVLGGKKVPTSVKELKLFCKYRKSCYVASAEAKHKEVGIVEGKIGIAGQNETMIEIEEEKDRRKPKPNSDSSHENVEEEEDVVPNGIEEMKEEEKKNEEEIKKEEGKITSALIQMPTKFGRRRKKAVAANPKPKMMETVIKKEEEKKKIELKPKPRERKQKRYKIVDVMPMEEPVMFGEVDKVEEDEERNKREEKEEYERMKEKDEDEDEGRKEEKEEIEEKQKANRKNKKYVQEEAKKDGEEERKIWAKREVKLSKLECRYRKSCYKSGIVPEWTAKGPQQFGLWTILMGIFEGKKGRNDELDDILAWRGMGEKERWFRCKYRKSCYERMNKRAGSEMDEGKRKKKMMKSAAKIVVPPVKKEKKLVEKAAKEFNVPASSTRMVDLSTKLQCKYRKSCYEEGGGGNVPKVMERIVDSIEGGQRNWTGEGRCNPWRISCRQAMGLPIKEKAPIGPNGKRLCRKRKSSEENNK